MLTDTIFYRRAIDRLRTRRQAAKLQLTAAENLLETSKRNAIAAAKAQQIAQELAAHIQQQVHDKIASLVTRCLQAVFDESHEFEIQMERKRGRTEAKLVFRADGHPIVNAAQSGGVIDVAAFALRLACLMVAPKQSRRLLVLDEPFKNVHGAEYRARVAALLDSLAEEMEMQIIIVTGVTELRTGLVVEL